MELFLAQGFSRKYTASYGYKQEKKNQREKTKQRLKFYFFKAINFHFPTRISMFNFNLIPFFHFKY